MTCVHRSAGTCLLGLHGGTPSLAVCLGACTRYEGPPRGAGDIAASAIKAATFGMVRPCAGCGRRVVAMNKALPLPTPVDKSGTGLEAATAPHLDSA